VLLYLFNHFLSFDTVHFERGDGVQLVFCLLREALILILLYLDDSWASEFTCLNFIIELDKQVIQLFYAHGVSHIRVGIHIGLIDRRLNPNFSLSHDWLLFNHLSLGPTLFSLLSWRFSRRSRSFTYSPGEHVIV